MGSLLETYSSRLESLTLWVPDEGNAFLGNETKEWKRAQYVQGHFISSIPWSIISSLFIHCLIPLVGCKIPDDRICSGLLYPKCLEECTVHSRYLLNGCWMNELVPDFQAPELGSDQSPRTLCCLKWFIVYLRGLVSEDEEVSAQSSVVMKGMECQVPHSIPGGALDCWAALHPACACLWPLVYVQAEN